MAKIKFGMMMTDARGKLGGQVFSKNRAGAYVRTKVTPVNPRTTHQQANRSLFGAISSAWRVLSDPERASWSESVEQWQTTDIFGDIKNPSGKTLFQRLNQGLLANITGSSVMSVCPAPVEIPIVSDISSELTIDDLGNTWSVMWSHEIVGTIDASNYVVQLRATPPMSPGRTYHKNLLRLVAVNELEDDTFNILASYEERFGRLPRANEKVYIEVRVVSILTGQIGVPYSVLTSTTLAPPAVTSFSVNPTSGDAPYVLTAVIANQENIDNANYALELRATNQTGTCFSGTSTGANQTAGVQSLINTGEYTIATNSVTAGDCRVYSLIVRDLNADTVISSQNVSIDNS